MKCKNCDCCHEVVLNRWDYIRECWRKENVYQCWGVKEPFIIRNLDNECTEYPDRRDRKIPSSDLLTVSFDDSQKDVSCMVVSRGNIKSNYTLQTICTILGEDAIEMYKKLTGIN